MLSKEKFVEIMNTLDKKSKQWDKLRDDMNELSSYFPVDFYPCIDYINIIEELLVDIFNMPELEYASNDISYWMYEMDFGREAKSHPIRTNNKTYILDTAEKLYDYLMEWKKDE